MTYWIVIAMIFVAILTVSIAVAHEDGLDDRVAADDAEQEEGLRADDDFYDI